MKLLLTTVAAAMLIGTSAYAQSPRTHARYDAQAAYRYDAQAAYNRAQASDSVYAGDRVIGRDPDAQVRLDLHRQGAFYSIGG